MGTDRDRSGEIEQHGASWREIELEKMQITWELQCCL